MHINYKFSYDLIEMLDARGVNPKYEPDSYRAGYNAATIDIINKLNNLGLLEKSNALFNINISPELSDVMCPIDEDLIVYDANDNITAIGQYKSDDMYLYWDIDYDGDFSPTHWCLIPKGEKR